MSTLLPHGCIYRVTYPNGKIYIGQDRTDDINYFGSADSAIVARDFSRRERRDFTVRKEILWSRRQITIHDLNQQERRWITQCRSNDPAIGYNQTHRGRRTR